MKQVKMESSIQSPTLGKVWGIEKHNNLRKAIVCIIIAKNIREK